MSNRWHSLSTDARIGIIGILIAIIFGIPAYIALIPDRNDANVSASSVVPIGTEAVTTTTAVPFPDPEEQRVLDNISSQFRSSCLRDEDPFEDSLSGVWCTPPSGADTVFFGSFENTGRLSAAYYGVVDTAKVKHDSGTCAKNRIAELAYGMADKINVGRVACYIEDGEAWMAWTNEHLRLLGWAFRSDDDSDALYRWWVNSGRQTE